MSTKQNKNQKGLGKGLGALLGQTETEFLKEKNVSEKVLELSIDEISPNKEQPRKVFDQSKLEELAKSIKEHGILEPMIVIEKKNPDYYMIIAGERRWRAAKIAGLKKVPAIIRDLEDHLILQHSIIENIQREDLNPIEQAIAFQNLIDQYSMTQEMLAEQLGKSRSAIANTVRLINLPDEIKQELVNSNISAGHARCLLSLKTEEDQINVCETIIQEGLNVRQTEQYINQLLTPKVKSIKSKERSSAYLLSIKKVETDLSKSLGTKVKLRDKNGKGKIEINYSNNDELERLLDLLK
ncbi:MAG: ParB/RepB/Spo0J family partition protein [Clostridiaceae bacterium]|nr:ParB/RepB/Spo0J family partition protein [Clostridiaceae bacterium]